MGRDEIISSIKDKTIFKKLLLVISGGGVASGLSFLVFSTFFATEFMLLSSFIHNYVFM